MYSEQTSFKTLKSVARVTGLDAAVPIEVQVAVHDWLEKYQKRQEQGQLGGRSYAKKEPGTEAGTQPLWQQPGRPVQVGTIREGGARIRELTCPEDRHHRLPLQAARTRQPGTGKCNGSGHGDSGHTVGTWVGGGGVHGVEGAVALSR